MLSLLNNIILIQCNLAPDPLCQVRAKTSLEGEGIIGGRTSLPPPPLRGRLVGGWDYSGSFKYFWLVFIIEIACYRV